LSVLESPGSPHMSCSAVSPTPALELQNAAERKTD
jgi:hypothetical protein